jgi:hypothetical protein
VDHRSKWPREPAFGRRSIGGSKRVAPMKATSFTSQLQNHLIGIVHAAAILGVSPVTVRRRVRDASLPHIRIQGRLYFKIIELHAYIEAHRGALA